MSFTCLKESIFVICGNFLRGQFSVIDKNISSNSTDPTFNASARIPQKNQTNLFMQPLAYAEYNINIFLKMLAANSHLIT